MLDNASFKLLEQGLNATWYKQKVISQNIANNDTPDYKAKTVDFKVVLDEKCDCSYHSHDDEFCGKSKIEPRLEVTVENNTRQVIDGNNVDMEKETLALADAQYQYSAIIDQMNSSMSMLRSALQK